MEWKEILPGGTAIEAIHLVTPDQIQLPPAAHLFITAQGTATIEGATIGEDNQLPQARPTQAVWVTATTDTDITIAPDAEWAAIHCTMECTNNNPTTSDWQARWSIAAVLCNRSITASHYISDHKNCGQKKPGKRQSNGLLCLDKAVLAQGGGVTLRYCS